MDKKPQKFNKIVFLERIPIGENQIEILKTFAKKIIIPKTLNRR